MPTCRAHKQTPTDGGVGETAEGGKRGQRADEQKEARREVQGCVDGAGGEGCGGISWLGIERDPGAGGPRPKRGVGGVRNADCASTFAALRWRKRRGGHAANKPCAGCAAGGRAAICAMRSPAAGGTR